MIKNTYIDVIIVGAGIVGLSIAESISKRNKNISIAILEKHPSFGIETSSRNSEVIHAGIYYPPNSLKSKYCIAGRDLLYSFCKKHKIPYKKCGKFIVSNSSKKSIYLDKIYKNALANNVLLDKNYNFKKIKNLSHFGSVLWSPETGIINSHQYMKKLESIAINNNVNIAYKNSFSKFVGYSQGFNHIEATDENLDTYKISCRIFINAAGLTSAKIASQFIPNENYLIKPCRGRYFSLNTKYNHFFENLIYPIPDSAGGLGIHITLDLDGKIKLGPDVDWSFADTKEASDHTLYHFNFNDLNVKKKFFESGKFFIPHLNYNDIIPDYIGVRPKLFVNNKLYEDFLIKEESFESAYSIHLLGVESPGLTSSLALADDIANKVMIKVKD